MWDVEIGSILRAVDTHLKERLVGAAVLVAAAVILIPEMLSGTGEGGSGAAPERAEDAGVRTYTIDLANPGQAQARTDEPAVVEEPAPPPEVIEPEPAARPAEAVAAVSETAEPPTAGLPPVAPPPSSPLPPSQAPSPTQVPRNLPWAVQVGSFASQATADRVKNELAGRGYQSYVVPFKTATQTLYRVRIGPMQERSAADAAVQKLKAQGTNATVVSNS
jgi:DedD protein